ncbi:ArsR/SmtB family transcription factor [Methylovirgula sp. 4M-Z18]|uniref:ArsR/SmtB family transcription factor n=1 Tax=Methylovirgula sp. 4M-Z18 TaxID=2293567 RepID=UPI000E2F126A|nr:winged helix-turn-helix domain-containing protein [Methylovirgula sp. 4M-Z18]RFB76327.1 ArsR family transcriptional regulator [Methylovirgula sp. 4M-Z18]
MTHANQLAEIAALVGDPARAAMLLALMDGRALTATELAASANITPQTASSHLAKLTAAQLLKAEAQGRHRYHRLSSAKVAHMLEGLMELSPPAARPRKVVTGPRDAAMRRARSCYDHIAGRLGVAIATGLQEAGAIRLNDEAGLITERGFALFDAIGLRLPEAASKSTRPLCRPCLDWSERRPHLAGRLGQAICDHCLEKGWVRRQNGNRALDITPIGHGALHQAFGVELGL